MKLDGKGKRYKTMKLDKNLKKHSGRPSKKRGNVKKMSDNQDKEIQKEKALSKGR